MLNFNGRVAIVTGSGRGLGLAYAKMLVAHGARVVINDVNRAAADEAVTAIVADGGAAVADSHDVTTSAGDIVAAALSAFGRLDILINNAGIVRFAPFPDEDPSAWWRAFNIHVRGTVEMTRVAWPHLKQSGSGVVINVASSSMLSQPGISSYSAAKGAIWGFSNTLADEGARDGIRVHCLMPTGWSGPAMLAPDGSSFWDPDVEATLRGQFPPERVADFVVWLSHQDTPMNAETKTFWVGGGWAWRMAFSALLPGQKPTEPGPDGWIAVADKFLKGSTELRPFFQEAPMLHYQISTINPALKDKRQLFKPTGIATSVAKHTKS